MKEDEKLGIGIVGCGTISDVHAEAIQSLADTRLVSVFDRESGRAEHLGRKFGVSFHARWDSFIRESRLDAVSICTPSGTHLDYGKSAAAAGKHVIVEKPIEVTLDRGKALMDACKACGVALAVIFQNRFLDDAIRLRQLVQTGGLGKIFLADAYIKWFRQQSYYDSAAWRGTLALDGGGVLINQAIHTVDLLQWVAGRIRSVFGQTGTYTHDRIEGEDAAVAAVRFANGAIGVIEGSTSVKPAVDRRLEIHGESGTAVLEGNTLSVITGESATAFPAGRGAPKSGGASAPLQNFSTEPHRRQFQAIGQAIRAGTQPPVSGKEALDALAVVLAVYESARRQAPVDMDEWLRPYL